jgi:hypothetical protein
MLLRRQRTQNVPYMCYKACMSFGYATKDF